MSTSISRTVTVARPRHLVASYLSNFTSSAVWDPHTESCTQLDDGPVRVGARYQNVQRLAGRDSILVYEVVEYEPHQRIVLEGGNDTIHTRDEMTFSDTFTGARAEGTAVTYTVEVTLLGTAKVGTPLLLAAMTKIANDGAKQMHRTLLDVIPQRGAAGYGQP